MASNSILGVFAKSPIKPLEKHIRMVTKCCNQLIPFFSACAEQDWEKAGKIRKQLSDYERAADDLKRKLRLELPGGLFMPVDRADLLELLSISSFSLMECVLIYLLLLHLLKGDLCLRQVELRTFPNKSI